MAVLTPILETSSIAAKVGVPIPTPEAVSLKKEREPSVVIWVANIKEEMELAPVPVSNVR